MAGLPFEMYHLTEEMIERAKQELGETDDQKRKQALMEFRDKMKEENNLDCQLEDENLLPFLRTKKFDVQKSVALLRNFFRVKEKYKDVYEKQDFESIMKACRNEIITVLPYRDTDGAVIMVMQGRNWNVSELSFANAIYALTFLILGCLEHPATQICGFKFIIDTKGLGVNHVFHTSARILLMLARSMGNSFPVRFRAIHIVNESFFFPYAWGLTKFLLSEKLRKRIFFHGTNLESLHSKIDPTLLPESCGGTLTYDNAPWLKFVKERESYYYKMVT